ncbi:MAG: hypothetical protein ABJA70_20750, partial [Chryseolinea sp.]
MHENLRRLYLSVQPSFKKLIEDYPNAILNGPLLMSPNTLYERQKYKLLVVGREADGWDREVNHLDKQMDTYRRFNVGQYHDPSPFWTLTRKVESSLGNELYSCAWTTISKFDGNVSGRPNDHEKAVKAFDQLLFKEVDIINPEICLFFTGPAFDDRIAEIFKGVKFNEVGIWRLRQFCRLSHPSLPAHSYRIYHPNYLTRSGLE